MKARRSRSPSASPCCGARSSVVAIALTQGFMAFRCEACGQQWLELVGKPGEPVRAHDLLRAMRVRLQTALVEVYQAHDEFRAIPDPIGLGKVRDMIRAWEAVEAIRAGCERVEQLSAPASGLAEVIPLFDRDGKAAS